MANPGDDSGYASNSLTVSLDSTCGISIEDHLQVSTTEASFIDYNKSTYVNANNGKVCDKKSLKSQIEVSVSLEKPEFNRTSTPYAYIDDYVNQDLCLTPTNRKRKSNIDSDYCSFGNQSELVDTPFNNRSILNCTRKLWPDTSDGSLSDTGVMKTPSKKMCLEGSKSEPTSPQRNQIEYSPHYKLGSVEKNSVLYPNIRRRPKPKKYNISLPGEIRQQVKQKLLVDEVTSKLSRQSQQLVSYIHTSPHRVDFLTLFTVKSSHFDVIEHILSYLDPSDLAALYNVSKTARNCVVQIPTLNNVRKKYLHQTKINKENVFGVKKDISEKNLENSEHADNLPENLSKSIGCLHLSNNCGTCTKPTENNWNILQTSPRKREWLKFVKASADLTPGQKLTRCSRCSNPAKVINHIIICTRRGCQFVCCSECCDPLCLSVKYLEQYDISNVSRMNDFISSMPACSGLDNNNHADNCSTWLKKPEDRLFLSECSNKKTESIITSQHQSGDMFPNNTEIDSDVFRNSTFSSTFNLNILSNKNSVNMKRPIHKTVNDLIKCKTNKFLNVGNNVNSNLSFIPESPPKVNKSVVISSKISKKNLRRL